MKKKFNPLKSEEKSYWSLRNKIADLKNGRGCKKFTSSETTLLLRILKGHPIFNSLTTFPIYVKGQAKKEHVRYNTLYPRILNKIYKDNIFHIRVGRRLYIKCDSSGCIKGRNSLNVDERRYWGAMRILNEFINYRKKWHFTKRQCEIVDKILRQCLYAKSLMDLPAASIEYSQEMSVPYDTAYARMSRKVRNRDIFSVKVGTRIFVYVRTCLGTFDEDDFKNDKLDKQFREIYSDMVKFKLTPTPLLLISNYSMSAYQSYLFIKYYNRREGGC